MNLAERMALLRNLRSSEEVSEVQSEAAPSLAQRLQRLSGRTASPRRKVDDETVARLLRGEVIARSHPDR